MPPAPTPHYPPAPCPLSPSGSSSRVLGWSGWGGARGKLLYLQLPQPALSLPPPGLLHSGPGGPKDLCVEGEECQCPGEEGSHEPGTGGSGRRGVELGGGAEKATQGGESSGGPEARDGSGPHLAPGGHLGGSLHPREATTRPPQESPQKGSLLRACTSSLALKREGETEAGLPTRSRVGQHGAEAKSEFGVIVGAGVSNLELAGDQRWIGDWAQIWRWRLGSGLGQIWP